ncbi:MAG: cbb3-type cytochrome c oxidase subunit 3 [Cocleimonas sp.]|nr:cbb3-type cytochrome c oxidase subunit 3 [Cocleimonas sp.]
MLNDIFDWFLVMANNKSVTLVIFVMTFLAILFYVYGSKKRSERFETYRNIPFLDGDDDRIPYQTQDAKKNSHTAGEKK